MKEVWVNALARHALERAAAPAVIDGRDGRVTSHGELFARASRIAADLAERGVKPGDAVALLAPRSERWIAGLLGVLGAGGCVMALDPREDPSTRAAKLQRGGARAVVVDDVARAAGLSADLPRVVATDASGASGPLPAFCLSDDAFVSFEPGAPFCVSSQALAARLDWLARALPLGEDDRVVFSSAVTGDAWVSEVLSPLAQGASVLVLPEPVVEKPAAMIRALGELGATVLTLSAEQLASFLAHLGDSWRARLPRLARLLVGGESLPRYVLERLLGDTRGDVEVYTFLRLLQAGGEVCWGPAVATGVRPLVSIGKAAFQRVAAQDAAGRPVPPGIIGEMVVTGEHIARPLEGTAPASWRTGLRCRMRPDHSFELVEDSTGEWCWRAGRRMSLSTLAAALSRCADITRAALMVREGSYGRRLVAFVETSVDDLPRLQAQAQAQLLASCLPDCWVLLPRLPVTPEGEVDRSALSRLATFDPGELERAEERLLALPDVEAAVVVEHELRPPEQTLHLKDLLPDFSYLEPGTAPLPSAGVQAETRSSSPSVPALVTSPPREPKEGEPATLGAALERAAAEHAERGVIILEEDGREHRISYGQLRAAARLIRGALEARGVVPGSPVLLALSRRQDLVVSLWGCILAGALPTPLLMDWTSGPAAAERLAGSCRSLGPCLVICDAARVAEMQTSAGPETRVVDLDSLRNGPVQESSPVVSPCGTALLLLTSGSSGIPKAVMVSHASIIARTVASRAVYGLTSEEVSVTWLPLDHIGGLELHLRHTFLGCQQVHAPMASLVRSPVLWLDWMEHYRATVASGVNFACGLVVKEASAVNARPRDLSSVRYMTLGGEAVIPRTCRRFLKLLEPHGFSPRGLRPIWGMTETTSEFTTSDRMELSLIDEEDSWTDVGQPMPGASMRIVDADDQVLPEGVVGRLQVSGAVVTLGYFRNEEATRATFTADGWLKTGDLAVIAGGSLTIVGREKEVIIVNGLNYSGQQIVAAMQGLKGVHPSGVAACAVRSPGAQSDELAVFFTPEEGQDDLVDLVRDIRRAVVDRVGASPAFVVPLPSHRVPKTGLGKIRTAELRRQLEAGELDDILKAVDVQQGINLVPTWFFHPTWQRRNEAAPPARARAGVTALVVADDRLAERLIQALGAEARCIRLEPGDRFERAANDHFRLRVTESEDFTRFFSVLRGDGVQVDAVLHALAYSSAPPRHRPLVGAELEAAQSSGAFSVWALLAAVGRLSDGRPGSVTVVTARGQQIYEGELTHGEHGALVGLVRTAAREIEGVRLRLVDLEADSAVDDCQFLATELELEPLELEAAYRSGKRYAPGVLQANLTADAPRVGIVPGGVYVVTGGLGALGFRVARTLIQRYRARLVLWGRTPLERLAADEPRRQRFELLRSLSEDVVYEAVDVADAPAAQRSWAEIERRWGQAPDGAFHLAAEGNVREHVAKMDESRLDRGDRALLATMLRTKLHGSAVLGELLGRHPESLFVCFSSVNGRWGGATLGAYSAANSALDLYVTDLRTRRLPRTYVIVWPLWDEGAPEVVVNASLREGWRALPPEQAESSLWAIVARTPGTWIVGLDGAHWTVRSHRADSPLYPRGLSAFVASTSGKAPAAFDLCDSSGTLRECAPVLVQETPRLETGEIDRQALRDLAVGRAQRAPRSYAPPRTPTEAALLEIWREVLGLSTLGVRDDFFAVGGYSLLLGKLVARMREVLGREVEIATTLEGRTVEGVARLLDGGGRQSVVGASLIPLRTRGHRPPLFLSPTGFGTPAAYYRISQLLAEDRPVYGFVPPGLKEGESPVSDMEGLAASLVQSVRTVQAKGPYHVAGWSGGGNVAFAMAQHLRQEGDQVAFIGLFDSMPRPDLASDELSQMYLLVTAVEQLRKVPSERIVSKEQLGALSPADRLRYLYDLLQSAGVFPPEVTFEALERYLVVFMAHGKAVSNYLAPSYPGKVALFRAQNGDALVTQHGPSYGWEALAEVQVVDVPGDHMSMMEPGNVERLAASLTLCLEAQG